jgi:hypothetical protein
MDRRRDLNRRNRALPAAGQKAAHGRCVIVAAPSSAAVATAKILFRIAFSLRVKTSKHRTDHANVRAALLFADMTK